MTSTPEQALLGALITNPSKYTTIQSTFRSSFFHNQANKIIYEALEHLIKNNSSVDLTSLSAQIGEDLEKVGGIVYLTELTFSCSSSENAQQYADLVRDAAVTRQITKMLDGGLYDLKNKKSNNEVLQALSQQMQKLMAWQTKKEIWSGTYAVQQWVEYVCQQIDLRDGGTKPMKYGIDELDDLTHGMHAGQLIVIGAAQGVGKSMVGLNLQYRLSSAGHRTLFYSMEMTHELLTSRMVAMIKKYPVSKLMPSKATVDLIADMEEVGQQLETAGMCYRYEPMITLEQIEEDIVSASLTNPFKAVVIDYLQIMSGGNAKTKREEIMKLSQGLKRIANKHKVVIIALAQLNREGKKTKESMPDIYHLAESSSIEQDADTVILLWKDPNDEKCMNGQKLLFLLRKNRVGESYANIHVLCNFPTMQLFNSILA